MPATETTSGRLAYMRLYVHDILSDPDYMALTTELKGAYDQLLFRGWQMGASLPDDDEKLRGWTGLSPAKWKSNRATVMAFFRLDDDGRWRQKRQVIEFDKAIEEYRRKSEGGKSGGRGRPKPLGEHQVSNRSPNRSAIGVHIGVQKQSESESESESKGVPTPKAPKGAGELPPIPESLQIPKFLAAWDDWQAHRLEIRHKLTPLAAKQQLQNCVEWGPDRAVLAIRNSIGAGWQKLVEPTGINGNGHGKTRRELEIERVISEIGNETTGS